jgi:RNA polymerase sigma-70 factor, ECF subfamily
LNAEEQIDEQVLVLRCQAGDEQAFARLFERYNAPLKYYLRRLLSSPELADDALQTVWLKVLRGVKGLRKLDAFRAWLYRVARNEAFQHLRRGQRWVEVEQSIPIPEAPDEEIIFGADEAERVHAALEEVSPSHRDVLVLRFLEDLSYEEIASVVGVELGTVRSRIHYAKHALRRVMEEWKDED